ncbi:hypothetical protein P3X46_005744 [Hevea brasiliensis]|uniref:Uncharacterized protein n=1 Tax=Hevea brasiliensis TaxID=3981 RepID=A0ABQ9N3K4_HEVBR|nr:hypothetical protein P3X46_005744 [Hevea brasiliensis]
MYPSHWYPQNPQTTMGTQNPIKGVARDQAPPPPLTVPTVLAQEAGSGGRCKAKMIDYLKLDALKYKERDDLFKYVKVAKMIADKLDASDSKAIQMTGFTLKYKKAKEWYKAYIASRIDNMT